MFHIIRAQLYQYKKDKLLWISFLVSLILSVIVLVVAGVANDYTFSQHMAEGSAILMNIGYIFLGIMTGRICCGDFMDKTNNYEILSGHSRREVFFARVILCLGFAVVGELIINTACFVVGIGVDGLGTAVPLSVLIGKQLLMIVPMLRVVCFFILVSYIVRNQFVAMGLGFFCYILAEPFSALGSYVSGLTNVSLIGKYESFTAFTLQGKLIHVYTGVISMPMVLLTIAVSVFAAALWLTVGYYFFRKEDLR